MAQTDVLDYIRQTPHNSNVNVVKGMLGNSDGGSLPEVTTEDNDMVLTVVDGKWDKAEAGGDPGYSCSETSESVFDGQLISTQVGNYYMVGFPLPTPIESDTIVVTLNGDEYELPKNAFGYGETTDSGPIFTTYPCFVTQNDSAGTLFTQSQGQYSVKIQIKDKIIETSECFEKAVEKVVPSLKYIKDYSADNGGVVENLVIGISVIGGDGRTHVTTEETANKATGEFAHVEGGGYSYFDEAVPPFKFRNNIASGDASHAEGFITTASGHASHAEGSTTTASGNNSHAEGTGTTASGNNSHAQNEYTIAQGRDQTAIGKYNIAQGTNASIATTDYAFIIGNGANASNRSNAFAIKWDGTFVFANGTEITPAQFAQILALLN